MLTLCLLTSPSFAQGSTASKHCDYHNPDGTVINVGYAIKAWNKARRLGAPDYPKWQRPALIIWHPEWEYVLNDESRLLQRWGRAWSETQIDKKGRVNLCEYIEIWIPEDTDADLFIEVLAHEYLHLIWARRMRLEPEFKLEQAENWLDGGERWVRELLDQQDGPASLH